MQYITKLKLASVHQICEVEEKSTEFMIQYMQDSCNVDLDCVMAYMNTPVEVKIKLFKEVNSLVEVMAHIEQTF